jgi:hypothetical protein
MYGDCQNKTRSPLPPCLVVQWFQQQPRDFFVEGIHQPMGIVLRFTFAQTNCESGFILTALTIDYISL